MPTLPELNKGLVSSSINHVLPITDLNLKADLTGQYVNLKWTTVTESNSKYFDIERSADGINYASIGQVKAAGNSNNTRYYSLIDSGAYASINYYRIKAVDNDGKFVTSNTVKVKLNQQRESGIIVLSNPALKYYGLETHSI